MNKAKIPAFTSCIQHGARRLSGETKKSYEGNKNWKGRNTTVPVFKQHGYLFRKSQRIHTNPANTNTVQRGHGVEEKHKISIIFLCISSEL